MGGQVDDPGSSDAWGNAASALLNIWLGGKVAAFRMQFQVSVGDGGKNRAFIFIVARVLHGIGMDGGEQRQFRMFGMMG